MDNSRLLNEEMKLLLLKLSVTFYDVVNLELNSNLGVNLTI